MSRPLVLLIMWFFLTGCGADRQPPRDDVALYVPDDLEVTLWAESPMFFNPTNMDVDYRGRIWVTEAVNYRNFNNDSTRALHHEKGDRVVILEDTDHDGRADASKVFVQDRDLTAPVGIAVIGNRVYVSCSPNLLVYTDEDGDDKPDRKEVFLTGFGGYDHDHSLHAIVGGMDGNLYFNTGNAGPHIVTDQNGWTLRSGSIYTGGSPYNKTNEGNLKSDDGRVWVGGLALRISPEGKNLTVMGHNFRNAFELFVDSKGDMWQNDNDDQVVACRTSWLMEGGNAGYFSSDGTRYWQADQRPGQDVFTAHWHQDDPGVMPAGDNAGAGSPTGIVLNEGDGLGRQYRGMLFSADAGRNVVFGYHPERNGAGYDLGERRNFITSLKQDNTGYVWNDSASNAQAEKWFRPSDVTVGTDGALYVADWYDPVVGGHQMRDTIAYGRIYRIVRKGENNMPPNINLSTVSGLMEALASPAVNVRHTALQALENHGEAILPQVITLLDNENPWLRARSVWLLSRLGASGIRRVEALLEDKGEDIRLVAFRALRSSGADILPYASRLVEDPSSSIRREVAIALRDLPYAETKPLLLRLAEQFDGRDRWYLEALGAALERHASDVYPELLQRLEGDGQPADQWSEQLALLVWRLHPREAVPALKARAGSESLSYEDRSRAITALGFVNTPEAVRAMIDLSKEKNPAIAEEAAYWLSFRQGNDWYALWDWRKSPVDVKYQRRVAAMKVRRSRIMDPRMPFDERKRSARDMTRDAVGVNMLFGMVATNQLPADLHPFVREIILKNDDPAVRMRAASYFKSEGEHTSLSAQTIAAMEGNVNAGRSVFSRQCSTCHQVKSVGGNIGPDLTSIKLKFDRAALLEQIIQPNAGIVFGYEAWTINLDDGQSFFGFVVAEGQQRLTLRDLSGKDHVLEASGIASRKKQEGSLMPAPSALGLSDQDLADVVAYLLSI